MGCYVLAWVSYRSAVTAAKRFCDALGTASDLQHLRLWDAMALERPRNTDELLWVRGPLLTALIAGHPPLYQEQLQSLVYAAESATPTPSPR
jgi:hypothetical protein